MRETTTPDQFYGRSWSLMLKWQKEGSDPQKANDAELMIKDVQRMLQVVQRETLELAAKACIEADETGCDTGQFYSKVVLSVSGDT